MKLLLTTDRKRFGPFIYTVYLLRNESYDYISRGPLAGMVPPLKTKVQSGDSNAHTWLAPWAAILWAWLSGHTLSANVTYVFQGREVSMHVANWSLNTKANLYAAIRRLKNGPGSKPRDKEKVWVYYYLQQCHGKKPIFSFRYVED